MACADVVVGNSSSGLYEAPSFRVPTVDIGDRQGGRLAAASVVHSEPDREAIRVALVRARDLDCSTVINPYGDGETSARIVEGLLNMPAAAVLLKKRFHLLPSSTTSSTTLSTSPPGGPLG